MSLNTTPTGTAYQRHLFFGAAFVATLCVAGCNSSEKDKVPVVNVEVTPARRAPISEIISSEALVFPLQQAIITPKITSTIKTFEVQRGSRVRKGELLAVLENADLSAASEQSKGEYEQAQAGYIATTGASLPEQIQKAELDAASAKAAFNAQQTVYDSRKTLFDQGALPRRDLDSAEVALAQARSQYQQAAKQLDDLQKIGREQALKSATGQLSAAKGKYLGAQAQLSYTEIRSPIDGVVTDRPLFPGELATANQPLLTVMDTSKLIAKAHIAAAEAARLKVGDPAQIKLPGDENSIEARVTLVSPALDPGSTTIEVWVEAAKPDPRIRPGMTVTIAMTAQTVKDAIMVPAGALLKNAEDAPYVLVAGSDGIAHAHTVEMGIRAADAVQILSGVNVGDAVVTSGGYGLPDGTAVKTAVAKAPEPSTEKD
jgi:multidrug efflux pump subunit AcrA (membrane-fusion protein)